MGKNFYAVRKGRVTGIFATWRECERHVKGYSGAQFKGFKTEAEAEEYLEMAIITDCADSSGDELPPSRIKLVPVGSRAPATPATGLNGECSQPLATPATIKRIKQEHTPASPVMRACAGTVDLTGATLVS